MKRMRRTSSSRWANSWLAVPIVTEWASPTQRVLVRHALDAAVHAWEGVEEPPSTRMEPLGKLLVDVQVFGIRASSVAAQRLHMATRNFRGGTVEAMLAPDDAIEAWRRWIQRDLVLNETTLPQSGAENDTEWESVGEPDVGN